MTQAAPPVLAQHSLTRRVALAILCAGQLMMILDQTIVNVALPTIQADLQFTQSNLGWVVNAYLIPFGGLLLLAGRLGDLMGRKRIFLAGLATFTTASLACGLSSSRVMLLASRGAQGVGAALSTAVILGMVVTLFPEPRQQAKAIGVYAFVEAVGGSLGGLIGGVLTQAAGWHWIFLVNIPIGIVTGLAAWRILAPVNGGQARGRADVMSALLVTGALMLGVYAIVDVPARGWTSKHTMLWTGVATVLLLLFIVRQSRIPSPLLPLKILRSRTLGLANLILGLLIGAMFGFVFLGSLFIERVLGYTALQLGLALLPVPIMIAIFALGLSSRLIHRLGARTTLLPGLVAIGVGFVIMSIVPAHAQYAPRLLPAMLLLGAGFGVSMPALANLALSSVRPSDAGLASGIFNTMQQVGGALGLAVLVTSATSRTDALRLAGVPMLAALAAGYHRAFVYAAVFVVTGFALALLALERERPRRPARDVGTRRAGCYRDP